VCVCVWGGGGCETFAKHETLSSSKEAVIGGERHGSKFTSGHTRWGRSLTKTNDNGIVQIPTGLELVLMKCEDDTHDNTSAHASLCAEGVNLKLM